MRYLKINFRKKKKNRWTLANAIQPNFQYVWCQQIFFLFKLLLIPNQQIIYTFIIFQLRYIYILDIYKTFTIFVYLMSHKKMKRNMKSTFHLNYLFRFFAFSFFFFRLWQKSKPESQEQNMKSKESGKRIPGRGKNLVDRWKTLAHKVSCFRRLPRLKLNLTGYIYRARYKGNVLTIPIRSFETVEKVGMWQNDVCQ